MERGLWGPVSSTNDELPIECKFEDSFSPEPARPVRGNEHQAQDEEYKPLDDSSQYLASLERKLARIQGRTAKQRQKESQQLIDALAGSRDTHAHQLINTTVNNVDNMPVDSELIAHQHTAVDPQGPLGVMLRKLAPDRVALTHEELCQLLEADFLAKVREAAEEETREIEDLKNDSVRKDNKDNSSLANLHDNKSKSHDDTSVTPTDKIQLSDEGEK
ncbi:hypothetical protein SK128_028632 [Halocaridina rubra]|uniref:Uncharacterized protein n=1 Tax=Halocaridina rubra TaxID=373956 RepID=A0AAN8XJN6_HALRR